MDVLVKSFWAQDRLGLELLVPRGGTEQEARDILGPGRVGPKIVWAQDFLGPRPFGTKVGTETKGNGNVWPKNLYRAIGSEQHS